MNDFTTLGGRTVLGSARPAMQNGLSWAKVLLNTQLHPYLAFAIITLASFSVVVATLLASRNMVEAEPEAVVVHRPKSNLGQKLPDARTNLIAADPSLSSGSGFLSDSAGDIPVVIFPQDQLDPSKIPASGQPGYGYYAPPAPGPDYIIESLSVSPKQPKVSQSVDLTWTIKNGGSQSGPYPGFFVDYGSFQPSYSELSKNKCSSSVPLKPGASCTVTVSLLFDQPGVASIIVKANQSKENFSESNYNNNWRQIRFTVSR